MTHSDALRMYVSMWEQGPGSGPALVAYRDSGGVWTIGYGRTTNVHKGDTCTAAQAEDWLDIELAEFAAGVDALVNVPLEQHQFDALTSFAYNCGLQGLEDSTLIKRVNGAEHDAAALQLLRWAKDNGRFLRGLLARRAGEALMYSFGEYGAR